ncbi:mucin-2-like [Scylla paramamosain]|uniref:mucin-2-like n=1 Tax=Scylla paramamosain TaxID=85552 RepID=UPI00308357F8
MGRLPRARDLHVHLPSLLVRRAGSPPRAPLEVYTRPQDSASSGTTQKVLAPTARRYIGLPEPHAETVVRAQVAVQPVNLALSAPRDTDARAPLDFSFRKPPLNRLVPPHSTAPAQPQHTGTAPPQHTTPSQTATHKDVPHLPSPKYVPALALCTSFRQSQTEGSSQQKPDIITIKRPLEEQDTTCTRPSKIAKTDYSPLPWPSATQPAPHTPQTPPSHLTPPSHTTPPSHMGSSLPLTPPSHTTPSMHLTPPSTTSPQSQVSSGVSPGSHASPGPSPTSQTTPRKVKSEGSPSPDRPSTSATQEDKDMWRPWIAAPSVNGHNTAQRNSTTRRSITPFKVPEVFKRQ